MAGLLGIFLVTTYLSLVNAAVMVSKFKNKLKNFGQVLYYIRLKTFNLIYFNLKREWKNLICGQKPILQLFYSILL